MFRCLASRLTAQLGGTSLLLKREISKPISLCNRARFFTIETKLPVTMTGILQCSNITQQRRSAAFGRILPYPEPIFARQWIRNFHAKGSKKMKKHRRKKWRKKFKCLLAKKRLKREIAKEKAFRVELLTMIKRAEQFDPREYAMRKINEINSVKPPPTREERLEELKELIRVNRYQVTYIKPKHKRLQTIEDLR